MINIEGGSPKWFPFAEKLQGQKDLLNNFEENESKSWVIII